MTERLGLYIHIPFCVRKCRYCDFLSFPSGAALQEEYVMALCREIRSAAVQYQRPVDTVFIGGGTPSVLPYPLFSELVNTVYEAFRILPDAEVTVEMNPGAVWSGSELDALFRKRDRAGKMQPLISRVSLGVQSFHDGELRKLGRIHDFRTFLGTYENLRAAGAADINFDLMFGIPGQTEESWSGTLRSAVRLQPEHISAYSLILEEGTPFYEEWENGLLPLPDETTERKMAHYAAEFLENAGFRQYEISNFARPGFESRHNIRYWRRKEYYGAGIGAASFIDHTRWRNTTDPGEYIRFWTDTEPGSRESAEACRTDAEHLTKKQEMEEFWFLGLRMTEGVSTEEFAEQFGVTAEEEYGEILAKYRQKNLIGERNGRIFLTGAGMDISNVIMSDFLHDDG